MENDRGTAFTLSRRIGSTKYTVNALCSDMAAETFEEKNIRLIRNVTMETGVKCGKWYPRKRAVSLKEARHER